MVWYTPIGLVLILRNEHRRRVDRCLMPLPTHSILRVFEADTVSWNHRTGREHNGW